LRLPTEAPQDGSYENNWKGGGMNYQSIIIQLPLVKENRGEHVKAPDDVARVCSDICNLAQETFQVLSLDAKNRLLDRHVVSIGIVDASLAHSREVFRRAIETCASAIIITHNHPSGDATPSAEDVRITKQLVDAGRILEIRVFDHVVLGRGSAVSMREAGLVQF
jgi:DNA repair protein RadC